MSSRALAKHRSKRLLDRQHRTGKLPLRQGILGRDDQRVPLVRHLPVFLGHRLECLPVESPAPLARFRQGGVPLRDLCKLRLGKAR
ncbi:hypothetical protein HT585_10965 [Ensifer sp. HO-A22]|uniref:Uncharacterized protein n=1 Tax=Ensifer oleiphilus TaxID=2742698 RepID=A0A7Y6Q5C4_9HYPH|nr:hypothetical protein [Ensifer oleiphilus]NVD39379.1 hypothetical protein [Ensifer oleiphilus]